MTPLRRAQHYLILCAIAAACLPAASVQAEVRLPAIFSDNMVLQREMEIPVWGWADAGETVTITLGDQEVQATANDKGEFSARLAAMDVGGGKLELKVAGSASEVTCSNVLIGEVWLASGQSNMEWAVQRADNADEEIEAADHPEIRLFQIPHVVSGTPQDDVNATWKECSPETIRGFSAVAYYFGRELHRDLALPIGLIDSSWGGTRIEPWTPPEGFAGMTQLEEISKRITDANKQYDELVAANPDETPAHPLAENNRQPTALYNGMIHGIVPYGIRGAIWYQGESNRGDAMNYFYKMDALISGWREIWDQGNFPFYFVQLAPYKYGGSETALPEMWEAQTAALTIPNTGMAVTVDIGNVSDIHPTNKQEVGRRLALWALANNYGKSRLIFSGPSYTGMSTTGNKVRLRFEHVGAGLTTNDGEDPSHFEIAGEDGEFVPAQAKIVGNAVEVWADSVAEPTQVRYGWHQEAEPNLMNKDGLPASPFRTNKPRIVRGDRRTGR